MRGGQFDVHERLIGAHGGWMDARNKTEYAVTQNVSLKAEYLYCEPRWRRC